MAFNRPKIMKAVKTGIEIAKSENPGQTAGKVVRTAVTAAHPIVGAIAGKHIEKATENVVNRGLEIAKDPEVQAKVKEVGGQVAQGAVELGNNAMKAIRRGVGTAGKKIQEFRAGHGGAGAPAAPTEPTFTPLGPPPSGSDW